MKAVVLYRRRQSILENQAGAFDFILISYNTYRIIVKKEVLKMKISTKGRYALRLMLDLAEHNNGEYISLKEISARQEISVKYLEQIVTLLCKAGFLLSVRGPQGGYKLAKDPGEYTAGAILRVTEGSLAPVACLETDENRCTRAGSCAVLSFWEGLNDLVNQYVDSVTLEDLVHNDRQSVGYEYTI